LRLIVTGGGTGGHVYPALEIAKRARDAGDEVAYFGSLRGQEGRASEAAGFPSSGFPAEPLFSIRSLRGVKSLIAMARARSIALKAVRSFQPDAVFSTGGYSAGPVVSAANSLRVPFCIHEGNSVPGRANLMFAKKAFAFTTLFKSTSRHAPNVECIRVGQPIRRELRVAANERRAESNLVLCVGGSQGSEYLNGSVPRAFAGESLSEAKLLLASGPKNSDSTTKIVESLELGARVKVEPYLSTEQMLDAYRRASVVVARSGSTLAEFAAFRIPSVLVPLPTSAGNHQLHNAEEFVEMKAATLLDQESATPLALAEEILGWLSDSARVAAAERALGDWDLPDATERIYDLIVQAGNRQ
jgi:UDP-N-acetylglucosamine--N-acetylmuramyl-(pentapeptide) pyrophosphoryl-undecaprenol N-acetylglucosamine transferase